MLLWVFGRDSIAKRGMKTLIAVGLAVFNRRGPFVSSSLEPRKTRNEDAGAARCSITVFAPRCCRARGQALTCLQHQHQPSPGVLLWTGELPMAALQS
jgi:hypothetical protein